MFDKEKSNHYDPIIFDPRLSLSRFRGKGFRDRGLIIRKSLQGYGTGGRDSGIEAEST
ncbi:MAG TPA: hypothetical protein VHO46_04085 [Bacteroidales bacterium]|nr:hypothetical protein [Bacteroidales bacterium]